MRIIIPARKNSKGLPFKNRKLFKHTASTIPEDLKEHTYVVTDDETIIERALICGFNVLHRPIEISQDHTSTKEVLEYVINQLDLKSEDITMLYLTYPERTWIDIKKAINIFKDNNAKSLLCKKKIELSPYLILKSEPDNRGSQLFKHDLYRRQDYPECFEISHFISIFNSDEIFKLNNNVYNKDTYFMEISKDTIDVDYQKDINRLRWEL